MVCETASEALPKSRRNSRTTPPIEYENLCLLPVFDAGKSEVDPGAERIIFHLMGKVIGK